MRFQNRLTRSRRVTAVIALAGLTVCPAFAQDRTRAEGNELLLAGEPVIFSAAKKAQSFREVPAAVTVITDEEIRRWGLVTLPDILRMAVGVDVMEANRSQQNVSIRGFNEQFASRLLVMVNGRSIYQDFFGGVFWPVEPLLITSIKRIEIVHGPGSALYGANAFLGVINIITRTPEEQRSVGVFSTSNGFGSHGGVFSETLHSGGDASSLAYTLGAGLHKTNGFGNRMPGEVRDSYTSPVFTVDLQHKAPRGNVNLGFRTSDSTADLSAQYYVLDGIWKTRNFHVSLEEQAVKNPILARYFATTFHVEERGQALIGSTTHDFEIQQQRKLSRDHSLVVGANLRAYVVRSVLTGPDDHSQSLYSGYAQDEWRLSRTTALFTGLRVDHNTLFGTHVTPRLSLTRQLPADQTVRVSYGTSFRNPTLTDTFLRYPLPIAPGLNGTVMGSPSTEAEEVTSYELGYRRTHKKGHFAGSVYHNKFSRLLAWQVTAFAPSPPLPPGVPLVVTRVNNRNARSTGLELEGAWRFSDGLRLLANYAYQDLSDTTGRTVDFSAKHKVNLGVEAALSRTVNLFLGAHYVGSTVYHDTARPSVELRVPAYTQVDAHLAFRFGGPSLPLTLGVSATNLLNQPHREWPVTAVGGTVERQSARHGRTQWVTLSGVF